MARRGVPFGTWGTRAVAPYGALTASSLQPVYASRLPPPASGRTVEHPVASVLETAAPLRRPDSMCRMRSRSCWRLEAGGGWLAADGLGTV